MKEVVEKAVCHENMAFIAVPHLSREYESKLSHILSRISTLTTKTITHNMQIEKCHLYVLPPGQYARVEGDKLVLDPRPPEEKMNCSANILFHSLAEHYQQNAIGVVLSGAAGGQDGREGIIAIREKGGHTYAQKPASAEFPQMPQAAIDSGSVELIMEAKDIGHELTRLSWSKAEK